MTIHPVIPPSAYEYVRPKLTLKRIDNLFSYPTEKDRMMAIHVCPLDPIFSIGGHFASQEDQIRTLCEAHGWELEII